MDYELTTVEGRVLGALIEKAATTPEYYPLSMRALQSACNQKSNRDPVMELGEGEINEALEELRVKQFATLVSVAGSRVPKFKYRLDPLGELGEPERAVLCLLLLRGAQTPGELRSRSARLYAFDTLEEILDVLTALAQWGGGALLNELAREPGRRESRYACLLSAPAAGSSVVDYPVVAEATGEGARATTASRIESLEREVSALKDEVVVLRETFEAFRLQFE